MFLKRCFFVLSFGVIKIEKDWLVILLFVCIFKPPPPVGAGGGYMFSGHPSVPLSVRPCVRPSFRPSVRGSRGSFMFPRYLQYLLTDFRQTFVAGASRERDDLIAFLGQKVKVQGHAIAAEAHSTWRYSRVQLFLVSYFLNFASFEWEKTRVTVLERFSHNTQHLSWNTCCLVAPCWILIASVEF